MGETLSEKRSRAGRAGAQARWGNRSEPIQMRRDHLRTARSPQMLVEGRTDWYRITNKTSQEADVYIYDEIGYFGVTARDFVDELNDIQASVINLHLNTPGGEVFDGIAIYNALRNHDAEVITHVDSLAASAGAFIAMAGDRRCIAKNGTMMIHDGLGLCVGNAKDMADMASLLDKSSDNIASIYAEAAGGETDEWREMMRAETWFNADEAVESGLMHEVTGQAEATNTWDLSIFNYSGREEAPAPVRKQTDSATSPEPQQVQFNAEAFKQAIMKGLNQDA